MSVGAPGEPAGGWGPRGIVALTVILATCSVAIMTARLIRTQGTVHGEPVPYLSANDRSRWVAIRALGDHDTHAIDVVLNSESGRYWDTIDKVMHDGRDGQPHFYSSKPPLMTTVVAYVYIALKWLSGRGLEDDPFFVVRSTLVIWQILPLAVLFAAVASVVGQTARTAWSQTFVVAAATFGTFLTTFAVTLNNHVPAAIATSIFLWAMVRIWRDPQPAWPWFALAGLSAAWAAACDLPAVSLVALGLFLGSLRSPLKTLVAMAPCAAAIGAAALGTNWIAHHDWRPPYAHRGDGSVIATVEGSLDDVLNSGRLPAELDEALVGAPNRPSLDGFDQMRVVPGQWPLPRDVERRWKLIDPQGVGQLAIVKLRGTETYELRDWANWYEYPGSYWATDNPRRSSVDRGEPDAARYAVHFLVGHHGVFSLTPIWLLSILGLVIMAVSRRYAMRSIALGILVVSVVVIVFYLTRGVENRNYGGLTSGPRWAFWLVPLWLFGMVPALDVLARSRSWQLVAIVLLAISVFSAFYAWDNPWTAPWPYEWFGSPSGS
jgi:hypothetical protein